MELFWAMIVRVSQQSSRNRFSELHVASFRVIAAFNLRKNDLIFLRGTRIPQQVLKLWRFARFAENEFPFE